MLLHALAIKLFLADLGLSACMQPAGAAATSSDHVGQAGSSGALQL